MENNWGKIIIDGKVIDLNKLEEKEAEKIVSELENKQNKEKSNIKKVLEELTQVEK